MTTYTLSVVATNSLGNGEAGVLNVATPGELKDLHYRWDRTVICQYIIKYTST